jgi:UDP-glucose 4-epimerase
LLRGAGFIGSSLVDRLLEADHEVVAYDNFSTGMRAFIKNAIDHPQYHLIEGDLLNLDALTSAMKGSDFVFHLAANADVRFGLNIPARTLSKIRLLPLTYFRRCKRVVSRELRSLRRNLYAGNLKFFRRLRTLFSPFRLHCTGIQTRGRRADSSFCSGFGMNAYIFRFVSIVAERYSDGHVFDFCKSLRGDSSELTILGNGRQRKSYLYIDDCIDAILFAIESAHRYSDSLFTFSTWPRTHTVTSINPSRG